MAKRMLSLPQEFEEVATFWKHISCTKVQHYAAQNEPWVFTNVSVFWIENNKKQTNKKEIICKCNSKMKNQNNRTRHIIQASYVTKLK